MTQLPAEITRANRLLTAAAFQQLADVPPAVEWFANLTNRHTRRAYENAVKDFMQFAGIRRPEEFRAVTRAHVTQWVFAALNSVEPAVQNLVTIDLFNAETAWGKERRPEAEQQVLTRLAVLEQRLEGHDYLEDGFTAADIVMVTVLRFLRHTDLVGRFASVAAYVERCEARPAFQRALASQMEPFREPVAA